MTEPFRLPLLIGDITAGGPAAAARYAAAGCDALLTASAPEVSALPPAGILCPLAGDLPMAERLQAYRRQAAAHRTGGAVLLYGRGFSQMNDARAALLAARECGLPVFMELAVADDGATAAGLALLPALITLQALGAAAVGIAAAESPAALAAMCEGIAGALPYAAVPLIAGLDTAKVGCSPAAYGGWVEDWLDAGAAVITGGGAAPEHLAVARGVLDRHPTVAAPEIDTDAVAGEGYACFLGEDLEPGEPLPCSSRLADALIAAEDERNAVCVHIAQPEDIPLFVEAAKVCRLPLAVQAASAVLLDETLLQYPGRLLVDGFGELEPDLVGDIAAQYGAIVY